MFVREKRINGYTYLYLVETVRENGRAKQRIIKNLGRKEALAASGALERLASSVARYAERAVVLSQLETGNPERLACKRIALRCEKTNKNFGSFVAFALGLIIVKSVHRA